MFLKTFLLSPKEILGNKEEKEEHPPEETSHAGGILTWGGFEWLHYFKKFLFSGTTVVYAATPDPNPTPQKPSTPDGLKTIEGLKPGATQDTPVLPECNQSPSGDCDPCTGKLIRPTDLPLYEPYPQGDPAKKTEEPPSKLEEGISAVRKEVWVWQDKYNGYREKVIDVYYTGKEHLTGEPSQAEICSKSCSVCCKDKEKNDAKTQSDVTLIDPCKSDGDVKSKTEKDVRESKNLPSTCICGLSDDKTNAAVDTRRETYMGTGDSPCPPKMNVRSGESKVDPGKSKGNQENVQESKVLPSTCTCGPSDNKINDEVDSRKRSDMYPGDSPCPPKINVRSGESKGNEQNIQEKYITEPKDRPSSCTCGLEDKTNKIIDAGRMNDKNLRDSPCPPKMSAVKQTNSSERSEILIPKILKETTVENVCHKTEADSKIKAEIKDDKNKSVKNKGEIETGKDDKSGDTALEKACSLCKKCLIGKDEKGDKCQCLENQCKNAPDGAPGGAPGGAPDGTKIGLDIKIDDKGMDVQVDVLPDADKAQKKGTKDAAKSDDVPKTPDSGDTGDTGDGDVTAKPDTSEGGDSIKPNTGNEGGGEAPKKRKCYCKNPSCKQCKTQSKS